VLKCRCKSGLRKGFFLLSKIGKFVGSLVQWLGFAEIVFVELSVDEDLSHFLGRERGFCRGREISCGVMLREQLTAIRDGTLYTLRTLRKVLPLYST
jgi:hypothetical protein